MIQSKEDYLYYLECDRVALRKDYPRPRFKHDIVWSFQRLLRKCEYYENCRHGLWGRLYGRWLKYRLVCLSQKLSFSIGLNSCGPGLCIEHYGTLYINGKVGKNFRVIGNAVIGATESGKTPVIGDNVFMGFGSAVVGDITIADGVAIGANAVVTKSIFTPDITVGGIPARPISANGSDKYLVKATDKVTK